MATCLVCGGLGGWWEDDPKTGLRKWIECPACGGDVADDVDENDPRLDPWSPENDEDEENE